MITRCLRPEFYDSRVEFGDPSSKFQILNAHSYSADYKSFTTAQRPYTLNFSEYRIRRDASPLQLFSGWKKTKISIRVPKNEHFYRKITIVEWYEHALLLTSLLYTILQVLARWRRRRRDRSEKVASMSRGVRWRTWWSGGGDEKKKP